MEVLWWHSKWKPWWRHSGLVIPKDLLVLRFTGKPYVPLALYGVGRSDYFVGYLPLLLG